MLELAQLTLEEIEYTEYLLDLADNASNEQLKNLREDIENSPHIKLVKMILKNITEQTNGEMSDLAKEKEKEFEEVVARAERTQREKCREEITLRNNIRTKLNILKNELIQ